MATKRTTRKKKVTKKAATRSTAASAKKRPASNKTGGKSLLDAAAAVLAKAKEPMSCPEMVEAVVKAGTWSSNGKTPAATLSAAIHREIRNKGKEARFAKAERGRFRLRTARTAKRRRSA